MYAKGKELIEFKGIIKAIESLKFLEYDCFTPEDENDSPKHTMMRYKLSSDNKMTKLSVYQGDFQDDMERFIHTEKNWDQVLNGLKKFSKKRLKLIFIL